MLDIIFIIGENIGYHGASLSLSLSKSDPVQQLLYPAGGRCVEVRSINYTAAGLRRLVRTWWWIGCGLGTLIVLDLYILR